MVEESKKTSIKIELTPEQQEQILQAAGVKVTEVQLRPETLEERVVPGTPTGVRPN
jgi:hypothetical protein